MKKLFHKTMCFFKFHKIDVLIYRYNGKDEIPNIASSVKLNILTDWEYGFRNVVRFRCFGEDGALVHTAHMYQATLLTRQLGYRLPVIGDCVTTEAFRGKKIYPFVLTLLQKKVCDFFDTKEVLIMVSPLNKSSIRGIEQAGFAFCERVIASRFMGIVISKTRLEV